MHPVIVSRFAMKRASAKPNQVSDFPLIPIFLWRVPHSVVGRVDQINPNGAEDDVLIILCMFHEYGLLNAHGDEASGAIA